MSSLLTFSRRTSNSPTYTTPPLRKQDNTSCTNWNGRTPGKALKPLTTTSKAANMTSTLFPTQVEFTACDNSSENLQLATFDEYYAHAERHQTASQVVERDVRSAEMDSFNPYIHDQNRQPYLKARYKVNCMEAIKYMDKEENGRTLAMSPDGPLAYLCVRPQQPKGVSVAWLVLDTFLGLTRTDEERFFSTAMRKIQSNTAYSVSNYGRVTGLAVLKPKRDKLAPRLVVNTSLQHDKTTTKRATSVYLETLVYENWILEPEAPLPEAREIIYMIHLDDNLHNNTASNLKRASYDEYYNWCERNCLPTDVRVRDVRAAELDGQYNPYIHDESCQPFMRTCIKVNTNGKIVGTKNQAKRTRSVSNSGPQVEIYLLDSVIKYVPVALVVLDTFWSIDKERRQVIFADGNVDNVQLENLLHATFEEKRQDVVDRLEQLYTDEKFATVDDSLCSNHKRHLISTKGRFFSMINGKRFQSPFCYEGEPTYVRMNSHSQQLQLLVYTAFRGPAPPGYKVVHRDGDMGNNQLSNLVAISTQEYQKRPIQERLIYDLLEAIPSQEDFERQTGCPSGLQLPRNYQVSNLGRIKCNGMVIKQGGATRGCRCASEKHKKNSHKLVCKKTTVSENTWQETQSGLSSYRGRHMEASA